MSAYRTDFEETKYMSFLIKDNLWKILGFIKKRFDSEPVYNEKDIQINATFHNDEMSKNVLIGFAYRWYLLTLFLK